MNDSHITRSGTQSQPALPELLARYLQQKVSNHRAGLGEADIGEVVPFEAVPVQPVDPQLAWQGAVAALRYFNPEERTTIEGQIPPDWPSLVAAHEPAAALPFSVGNFPQLVRNLQSLLLAESLSSLRPGQPGTAAAPPLLEWAAQLAGKRRYPQLFLVLGVLRLGRQFDAAAELIQQDRAEVPGSWQAAWNNEEASLAWHRGRTEEAADLWQAQPPSVPVLFNRGMAALFHDKPAVARRWLNQAVAELPDDDAWQHLGRLYVALAEMRS